MISSKNPPYSDYRVTVGDIVVDKRNDIHYLILEDNFTSLYAQSLSTGTRRTLFYESIIRFYQKVA